MRLQNDPRSNNLIFSKSLPPKWGKHLVKIKWLEDFTTIIWAVAKFRLSCSKQWQYKEVNPIVTCTPKESISSPGLKQQNCFLQLKIFFFFFSDPCTLSAQHPHPPSMAVHYCWQSELFWGYPHIPPEQHGQLYKHQWKSLMKVQIHGLNGVKFPGKGDPVPVTLLTSIFIPKEQNNFFSNLSIKSLVDSCSSKWWHRATMDFFLQPALNRISQSQRQQ